MLCMCSWCCCVCGLLHFRLVIFPFSRVYVMYAGGFISWPVWIHCDAGFLGMAKIFIVCLRRWIMMPVSLSRHPSPHLFLHFLQKSCFQTRSETLLLWFCVVLRIWERVSCHFSSPFPSLTIPGWRIFFCLRFRDRAGGESCTWQLLRLFLHPLLQLPRETGLSTGLKNVILSFVRHNWLLLIL